MLLLGFSIVFIGKPKGPNHKISGPLIVLGLSMGYIEWIICLWLRREYIRREYRIVFTLKKGIIFYLLSNTVKFVFKYDY